MARRVLVNGKWEDAPDAAVLPVAPGQVAIASPPPSVQQPPAAAHVSGSFAPTGQIAGTRQADWQASTKAPAGAAIGQATNGMQRVAGDYAPADGAGAIGRASWDQALATSLPVSADQTATTAPAWRSPEDLAAARRSAFLGGSDSMAGMKAVRSLLSDEVKNRGGDVSGGGSIPSVKFLESQLAKLGPAKGLKQDDKGNWTASNDKAGEDAVLQAMSFNPAAAAPTGRTARLDAANEQGYAAAAPQLAPSGNLPQAAMNNYMQTAMKTKLRATQQPLNEIATWQLSQQPIAALREEPGRDATLAAYAAQGEQPPTTPGEAVLAVGAANAFGTRAGQFKPGNTMNLGFFDKSKLKPLNSEGYYGGYNPGNYPVA